MFSSLIFSQTPVNISAQPGFSYTENFAKNYVLVKENPAASELKLLVQSAIAQTASVIIRDVNGKTVFTSVVICKKEHKQNNLIFPQFLTELIL